MTAICLEFDAARKVDAGEHVLTGDPFAPHRCADGSPRHHRYERRCLRVLPLEALDPVRAQTTPGRVNSA
ncbi:MAG TPA: hypothetical protein VHN14_09185 [Kofleriaceae bacterium]|nr:hypothetical protein [Kofleriaceae bacterium]